MSNYLKHKPGSIEEVYCKTNFFLQRRFWLPKNVQERTRQSW